VLAGKERLLEVRLLRTQVYITPSRSLLLYLKKAKLNKPEFRSNMSSVELLVILHLITGLQPCLTSVKSYFLEIPAIELKSKVKVRIKQLILLLIAII